jgi:hypothetical protein
MVTPRALVNVSFVFAVLLVALTGSGQASTVASAAGVSCAAVRGGAPWSHNGRMGTAYTVLGTGGASCSVSSTLFVRLTRERGYYSPPGWKCRPINLNAFTGQCTTRSGGVIKWAPKLK